MRPIISELWISLPQLRGKRRCAECARIYPWNKYLPRWEDDKTVQQFGWLEGRCPECGCLNSATITGRVNDDQIQ